MSYLASNIPAPKHYFFDRHGGVSIGKYASLNASLLSLDAQENIYKNLELTAQHFNNSLNNINILIQGTTNQAVYIDTPSLFSITADGAVTNIPDIILTLRTADCAPILFYDQQNQVIGVAHAGWRGALYGIIENTLDLMCHHGAETKYIAAAIGPCLQKQSFECQKDMRDEFLNHDKSYQNFFTTKDEKHWLFDAENFCIYRLQEYGIQNISASHINTYTDADYFSYRRNCHQNLISAPKDYPSHLSTIVL